MKAGWAWSTRPVTPTSTASSPLKVLPPEKVSDPDRKRRFIQEAKAASALNHPSIITIYDIDQADGVDYIAMEYVDGKTLDELIPRKGMRLSLALKYAVQIADALARAHGAGIIHRDLKPSNVMVDEHGLVKVLDFGLAKLTESCRARKPRPRRHAPRRARFSGLPPTCPRNRPRASTSTRAPTSSASGPCSMKC